MTHDKGYPDWLVLSARLLAQPSCGQVGGAKYICLIMFPCGYVKILQPVAICTVCFFSQYVYCRFLVLQTYNIYAYIT